MGMFSHLREALRMNDKNRLKQTQAVLDHLTDFKFSIRSLSGRPASLKRFNRANSCRRV
jgi:hypothetical protein